MGMGSTEDVWASSVNRYKENLVHKEELKIRTRTGMDHERCDVEKSLRSRFLQDIAAVVNEQQILWLDELEVHTKRVDPETAWLDGVADSYMPSHPFVIPTVDKNITNASYRVIVCSPEVAEDPQRLSKTEFEKFALLFLALEYWWPWEIVAAILQCRWGVGSALAVVLGLRYGLTAWGAGDWIHSWHGEGNSEGKRMTQSIW